MDELTESWTTYQFGGFRFVPARQLLLHRDLPVRIGTRALDLLHALVLKRGTVVSKEELIRVAWPDVFVDPSNLKVNIGVLRRTLRDAEDSLACIATVPGRGYRFVAPLQVFQSTSRVLPDGIKGINGELPAAPALFGRVEAMTGIFEAIAQARLLTIVGPAGVGKTSIATTVARELNGRTNLPVCFVDLAAIDLPQLVAPTIAHALGLDCNLADAITAVVEALRSRNILLVLDNCEHVLHAVSVVADHLCHSIPELQMIATSRESLRCRFESIFRLAPLACPPDGGAIDAITAITYPAFALIIERATQHGYVLRDAEVETVASICRRLEGLPLAIELAATRLPVLGATRLLERLRVSLEPLAYDGSVPIARHTTLVATLEWSYQLLSDREARLLRHVSMFGKAFALEEVIGTFTDRGDAEDVAADLEALSNKSLIVPAFRGTRRHYRLLDTTRKFASEKLRETGGLDSAMGSYARYLVDVFEQAEIEWHWRSHTDWKALYGDWAGDVRRLIDWAFEGSQIELGVRLTAASTTLWNEFSSLVESRARVETALRLFDQLPRVDLKLRLKLITAHASNLSFETRLDEQLVGALRESKRLAFELGDTEKLIRSTMGLAVILGSMGALGETQALMIELRATMDRLNDYSAAPEVDRQELMIRFYRGEIAASQAGLARLTREHAATLGTRVSRFYIDRYVLFRNFLAMTTWVAGDHSGALAVCQQSLDAASALGHGPSHCHALALAAIPLALLSGSIDLAQERVGVLIELINKHQIASWPVFARFYQAYIDAARGDAGALDMMREAVAEARRYNQLSQFSLRLVMLADAAITHDRLDIARAALDEAAIYSGRYAAQWCDAEFLHLKGLLCWREGHIEEAQVMFQDAINLGRRSGALSFALRAATSQARMAQKFGETDAALANLRKIIERFDESCDTSDVRAARAIIS